MLASPLEAKPEDSVLQTCVSYKNSGGLPAIGGHSAAGVCGFIEVALLLSSFFLPTRYKICVLGRGTKPGQCQLFKSSRVI